MDYRFQVIGYPIKHSLSPWIHEQFMKSANLQGEYTKNEIKPEELQEKFEQIKQDGIKGFNVTVPHKQGIIRLLDELDDTAEKMGAVNTVAYQDGKWIGFNTDGTGYVRSLKMKYDELFSNKENKKILLLGAGGAARAIFYALYKSGFKQIDLANRTTETARDLAYLTEGGTETKVFSLSDIEKKTNDYDLIVQTTSVGMVPNEKQSILPIFHVKESAVVSDIVYQPIKTRLLEQAEKAGAKIHFGHTMLLYQAQTSFEIWTGIKPETNDMDEQLRKILEGR